MKGQTIRFLIKYLFLWITLTCLSPALALDKVTLQLKWHHQFQFAGYYAAKELGYFNEAGLDVTLDPAINDVNPINHVLNGGAQYGVGSSDLLLIRNSGKPVVVLAVIFQHSPYVLLAMQRNGIESVHDLIGKKVMIDPYATEIIAYLKKSSVPLERLIQIKSNSYAADDLISGKADAYAGYSTNDPWYLNKAGVKYLTFTPRAEGIDFYGDNLFTTEAEIKKHPDRVQAFLEASLKGWRYALKHPEELADLMIAKGYSRPEDRAKLLYEAKSSAQLIHSDLIEVGHMHEERWQHMVDTYADLGMLPKNFSLNGFIYAEPKESSKDAMLVGLMSLLLILTGAYSAKNFLKHRRALQALKKNERFLSNAETAANIGSFVILLKTGVWECSPVMNQLFGISGDYPHTIEGWVNFMHPDFMQPMNDHLRQVIRDKKPFDAEYKMIRPSDGVERWMHGLGQIVYDNKGNAVSLTGTVQDITERKSLENALVTLPEDLQRSIGQELHDNLGQIISAISYQSQAIQRKAAGDHADSELSEGLDFIVAQSKKALAECKKLAHGLASFELETSGLVDALREYTSGIAFSSGIKCTFDCVNEFNSNDESLKLNIYRIVQEAASNAIRHSGATHLIISLVVTPQEFHLSVSDDGCGLSETGRKEDSTVGMGLQIMQYRAKQIGATLKFNINDKGGTEVLLEKQMSQNDY